MEAKVKKKVLISEDSICCTSESRDDDELSLPREDRIQLGLKATTWATANAGGGSGRGGSEGADEDDGIEGADADADDDEEGSAAACA
jgi:hypothetical protein